MRKQIAAANWKMNLSLEKAATLMTDLLASPIELSSNQEAVLVFPFLI
jgi:triosephosphate isomerase